MIVQNLTTCLRVANQDGVTHEFHALWLRETTTDAMFRDPKTGHKLQDAAALPLDLAILEVIEIGSELELRFSDGHRARYSFDALRRAVEQPFPPDLIGEPVLWNARLARLPWHDLGALQADPGCIAALLDDVARLGFSLVRGIPPVDQGSRQFLDLIGYTRITNNGDIEDIEALGHNAYDLSMTSRALEPHVDNPYRDPQPGYTTLHCLRNDAAGANLPSWTGSTSPRRSGTSDPSCSTR
jgi:gamma-butyrobetaine dioxygenase